MRHTYVNPRFPRKPFATMSASFVRRCCRAKCTRATVPWHVNVTAPAEIDCAFRVTDSDMERCAHRCKTDLLTGWRPHRREAERQDLRQPDDRPRAVCLMFCCAGFPRYALPLRSFGHVRVREVDSVSTQHRSFLLALLSVFLLVSVFAVVQAQEGRSPSATEARWSDAATWPDRRVPRAGDKVTIAAGKDVVLDVSPPALGGLSIDGKLSFADTADLELTT